MSFAQPHAGEDPRLEALRAVFSLERAHFGDVSPALRAARRLARDPRAPIYDQVAAAPIAWEHHYAPALFLLAWAWAACGRADAPPVLLVPVALGFALMASVFDVHALRSPLSRMLASYVLGGATLLQWAGLALLARAGAKA